MGLPHANLPIMITVSRINCLFRPFWALKQRKHSTLANRAPNRASQYGTLLSVSTTKRFNQRGGCVVVYHVSIHPSNPRRAYT